LRRTRFAVLLVLCLFSFPLTEGRAQSPAAIVAFVADETGASIQTAAIVVRPAAAAAPRKYDLQQNGSVEVSDLMPGDYEISATGQGFTSASQRVSLRAGETRRLRFTLRVGGLSEDVTVLGREVAGSHEQLRRLPGSVDIIERDTLEKSRVFTTNEALRKVAGLHLRDEEGLGLRPNIGFRGLNPTRSNKVLLLEDGIPLTYAPYGDNASYYHPPIERFERVEVLKGGAQIAYGPQTIAGLVNYITPAPPANGAGTVTLTGGNRGYFNGHAGYGNTVGRTGFLFDYMRKQGDGSRENISSELNDVNAKVVRSVGANQAWTLRGNYYSEDSNITYSGLREDEYRANPRANPFKNDFFYIDRYSSSATHGVTLNGNAALTTNGYFSSFRRHWWRQSSNSAQRPNDASDPRCGGMANLDTTCGNEGRLRQYYTWGVEPRLRVAHRTFGLPGETDFGVRLHFERQDRRQENGDTPTARDGVLAESNLRNNQAYSTFAQHRFFAGGWTITPGLRLEHIRFERENRCGLTACAAATASTASVAGQTSSTYVIPGVGVSYTAGEAATLFAGVHRGFAPPRTEDIITNQGGVVELDPELSWNYEVGARTTVTPGLRLDATFFRMNYENQVVAASLAGGVGATLTNGGATLHQGLEISSRVDTAALRRSVHNAYLRVAYTYAPIARFTGVRFSAISGSQGVSVSGNRLPYAPEQLLTLGVGYAHPKGIDLMLEAVHTSDQFGDDLNTVAASPDGQRGRLPAYTVWNAAVNYGIGRGTLFVTVKNLLDDVFIVDRARGILPGSPRLLHGGIRLRF
jgi:Fe(3+) dicitrate transport protein